jgi:hypothetical protein
MLLSAPAGRSAVVQVKLSLSPADAAPELFPIFSGYVTVTATATGARWHLATRRR